MPRPIRGTEVSAAQPAAPPRASTVGAYRAVVARAVARQSADRRTRAAGAPRSPRRLVAPVLKAFLHDTPQVTVRQLQHRSAAHVQGELFQLSEAGSGQLIGKGSGGEAEVSAQPGGKPL